MIRVLLVDDQKMVRESLKISLEMEADIEIVGTANNGNAANRAGGNAPSRYRDYEYGNAWLRRSERYQTNY